MKDKVNDPERESANHEVLSHEPSLTREDHESPFTILHPSPAQKPIPRRREPVIPRRELVTLLAYLETGSHKAAAHRLGISESTARQRVSQLLQRMGAANAAQAVWRLRRELEAERDPGS